MEHIVLPPSDEGDFWKVIDLETDCVQLFSSLVEVEKYLDAMDFKKHWSPQERLADEGADTTPVLPGEKTKDDGRG